MPTPCQVRRGHPTVHSETKYVELIVINDHQLVSPQAGASLGGGTRSSHAPHPLFLQFEQMRQSVVLTSNFAKSVVNLADVVSKPPLPLPIAPHSPPGCTHPWGDPPLPGGTDQSPSPALSPHTHSHPPAFCPPSPVWAQMYKEQLNTRIVLVAMETWADGDKIQVQDDLLETLARLMVYRREGLPEPSDATHLFS